ncbi:MAG: preprotein translocase subunit SecA [Acidobacteria bacterium]|nr:MAG: preprotein translocase subunit SecA [Acidobacteriota bacterium]
MSVLNKILRAGEGKKLKQLHQIAAEVGALEADVVDLTDAELKAKTDEFKERIEDGESLDDLMFEAFAVVREAAKRTLGQRHFDVQIMGGAALHFGWIAEMKTGEGKTLVSTLPVYLNALAGDGVHVVTVNDYLAKRDSEWMGRVHEFLGLEVGLIQAEMHPDERRISYAADLTYGTNNEFGFDYLRDNMAMSLEEQVQRGHNFAIVDEVDSILIDEARTPLIISGRVEDSAKWYKEFAKIAPRLRRDVHYEVEESKYQVAVTEEGVTAVEAILNIENLYDHVNTDLVHHLNSALRAKELYKKDVDYIVRNGEVLIVDEFTGRILEGRRYSEGLHQAIEAKESVRIKDENQTLATITLQNYFRLYDKLAGMTGTAMTEQTEFAHIYKLDVVPIPTNVDPQRTDQPDLVYKTEDAKFNALVDDIVVRHKQGQPILIGTVSIEKSERLSRYLKRQGIPHHVLNAKHHEKEAAIIDQAGRVGAVTVATNMAGRGVDIMLGGNPEHLALEEFRKRTIGEDEIDEDDAREVLEKLTEEMKSQAAAEADEVRKAGGLFVLGTERHESRRIDNQLRGRSGRQGDPGESRFYLSLEDDLMRLFASDKVGWIMERLKVPEDMPIEAKMVSRAIERAQRQVESRNFEIRKNVLKYDDVMNRQREIVYRRRQQVIEGEDIHEDAREMISEVVQSTVESVVGDTYPEDWDHGEILTFLGEIYPTRLRAKDLEDLDADSLAELAVEEALELYDAKGEEIGEEALGEIERRVMLSIIDRRWIEHLYEMDYLREGINLRALAQEDPLVAYQSTGYEMFATMMAGVKEDFVRYVTHVEVVVEEPRMRTKGVRELAASEAQAATVGPPANEDGYEEEVRQEPIKSEKVPRNAPCPCGSGKKYKQCHGSVTASAG